MTLFSAILSGLGLSQREAAAFLGVRPDTVKSWGAGRNRPPDGALVQLWELADRQEAAAQAAFDIWQEEGAAETIDFGVAADDHEAQQLGWPCVGAQLAVARRLWEMVGDEARIVVVPRGSTVATAAAADERERRG